MSAGNSHWRAELRAAGVPTRLPPASERKERPDRGYVEQPEERVEKLETTPLPPRRRILITPRDLIRYREEPVPNESIPSEPMPNEQLQNEPTPTPTSALDTFPMPSTLAPGAEPNATSEARPVASSERQEALFPRESENDRERERERPTEREIRRRVTRSVEFKLAAAARVARGESQAEVAEDLGVAKSLLSLWCNGGGMARQRAREERRLRLEERENAMPIKRDESVRLGAVARALKGEDVLQVAADIGVTKSAIYKWVSDWRADHGNKIPKGYETTSAPASAVRKSNGHATLVSPPSPSLADLPPPPSLRIDGLEEYINALIDRRVAQAVKAEIQKRFMGD